MCMYDHQKIVARPSHNVIVIVRNTTQLFIKRAWRNKQQCIHNASTIQL